jgi:hypothetical protein
VIEETKNWRRERIKDPNKFDKRSFRTIRRGDHLVIVGCPKGKWRGGRCTTAMEVQAILHPKTEKNPCRFKRAVKKYEEFNFREISGALDVKIPEIKDDAVLVLLGEVDYLAYISDKEGETTTYEHEFGEESGKKPLLFTNPEGNILVIFGGNFKVKDWLYD